MTTSVGERGGSTEKPLQTDRDRQSVGQKTGGRDPVLQLCARPDSSPCCKKRNKLQSESESLNRRQDQARARFQGVKGSGRGRSQTIKLVTACDVSEETGS